MAKGYIIHGDNNFIGAGAERIALINCYDCKIHPAATGITLISCSGIVTDPNYNNTVWVRDKRCYDTGSISGSSTIPISADGSFKCCYVDASAGNAIVNLGDPSFLIDIELIFIRYDSSVNLVTFSDFNGEKLNFAALPQDLIPTQGDTIRITTNGRDWFLI